MPARPPPRGCQPPGESPLPLAQQCADASLPAGIAVPRSCGETAPLALLRNDSRMPPTPTSTRHQTLPEPFRSAPPFERAVDHDTAHSPPRPVTENDERPYAPK